MPMPSLFTSLKYLYSVLVTHIAKKIYLFNDAHKTFHLQLYCVGYKVTDHGDNDKRKPLPQLHGLLFPISNNASFTSTCTIPHSTKKKKKEKRMGSPGKIDPMNCRTINRLCVTELHIPAPHMLTKH